MERSGVEDRGSRTGSHSGRVFGKMKSSLSSSGSVPRKILIRGVNWLGDAVMSMPAIQRLKEAHPQAQITILTPEKLSDLWRLHPCVEDVISVTRDETVLQVSRRLRWGNFDAGLIFPNSPRSAIELWLAKIPQRIGYARP